MRVIDKWRETTASVTSVNQYSTIKIGDFAAAAFRHRDSKGEYQYGR
jgi:hypothetical protein